MFLQKNSPVVKCISGKVRQNKINIQLLAISKINEKYPHFQTHHPLTLEKSLLTQQYEEKILW